MDIKLAREHINEKPTKVTIRKLEEMLEEKNLIFSIVIKKIPIKKCNLCWNISKKKASEPIFVKYVMG